MEKIDKDLACRTEQSYLGDLIGLWTKKPQGPHISKEEHSHRDLSTALRFGRDDKGEGGCGPEQQSREGQTADLSSRFAPTGMTNPGQERKHASLVVPQLLTRIHQARNVILDSLPERLPVMLAQSLRGHWTNRHSTQFFG
jgi:hypothetical protein